MTNFISLLFAWNDWLVLPVLAAAALVLHLRRRKLSTLVLVAGLLMFLAGRVLLMVYSQSPLHPGYIVGLVGSSFGFLAASVGGVWFLRKDYILPSKQA